MRVFVAGGSGAVGRALVPQLVAAGHHVTAMTRSAEKAAALAAPTVDAVVCDVFDRNRLAELMRRATPDVLIHQLTDLPAAMDPRQLDAIYARNNRLRSAGTRNLLDAAQSLGVRRVVVQSMGTWYRPVGDAIKEESDPLWIDAPEPIGTAVRTAETMEREVTERVAVAVALRYGAFYGAGTWYAADGEIARRMRSRGFPIVGAGTGITSFIHVADAASAAVAAVDAPESAVYNVADDEPATASEWMPAYAARIGAPRPWRVPVFVARLALGKAMTEWLTTMRGASNARLKSELDWRPRFPTWRDGFATLNDRP